MEKIRIALDGPSGAGKSSLAKAIAKNMGIVYVDTGALYRSIGLYVNRQGIDPHSPEAVAACLPDIALSLAFNEQGQRVILNGEDVSDKIRTPEMSMYASAVSAIPAVRAFLLETQRAITRTSSVIMDGRDIGTVIIPDAEVKIFLVASPEARAKRRYAELLAKGETCTYEEVLSDMIQRDKNDSGRAIAPAIPAEDAVFLDNSDLTFDETVEAALAMIREKTEG
ncbi:MAG: (d)CMP kinase [Clostridia bacterium]|nr:(d)CMP kinase [Clostridia bacterium]